MVVEAQANNNKDMIDISDDNGLKRRLKVNKLVIAYDSFMQLECTVLHYSNNNGGYGDSLPQFNYNIIKNTIDSFVKIPEGYTVTATGVDENRLPTFADGLELGKNVIPELLALESTSVYYDILTMQKQIIQRLDNDHKITKDESI